MTTEEKRMTADEKRKYVCKNWERIWPKTYNGEGRVCPLCGNGDRSKPWGSGLQHALYDPEPFRFGCTGASCDFLGDAVDLLTAELNQKKGTDTITEEEAIQEGMRRLAERPHNILDYLDTFWAHDVAEMKAADETKTGFQNLDNLTDGVYPGLYVIGALSSLGKTTFALQLADNLAAAGKHVLFFSLEQSQLELVSKSITRIVTQNRPNGKQSVINSLIIRKGFADYEVKKAIEQYRETIAPRMNIVQGDFKCNSAFILDEVNRYIQREGVCPIVFVDYLQIIQQEDARKGLREQIDSTVTDLKRLSREHSTPVFLISSVNRSNYLTPIAFESFKESGGIEYTADVIWGLQYDCLNEELFDKTNAIKAKRARIEEAKAENPRKIQLKCLKNRYGRDFNCQFDYFPGADLFKVSDDDDSNWTTV